MSLLLSRLSALALAAALGMPAAHAGPSACLEYKMEQPALEAAFPYGKGAHEVQLGGGYFGSLTPGTTLRPNLDFGIFSLRHGWMLTSAQPGRLSGNLEFLLDLYAGGVTYGPHGMLAGGTLLLRYNVVPPGRKFVPYAQIGAGGLFNDIYENRAQHVIGSGFEFNLETSLGLRYMFSDRCALFAEAGVRHISNANTASRNFGLNSAGGVMGVSLFY